MVPSLKERLLATAQTFKERAEALPAGSKRDVLLQVSIEAKITAEHENLLLLDRGRK